MNMYSSLVSLTRRDMGGTRAGSALERSCEKEDCSFPGDVLYVGMVAGDVSFEGEGPTAPDGARPERGRNNGVWPSLIRSVLWLLCGVLRP